MLIRKCEPRELEAVKRMSDDLVNENCLNGMAYDTVEYLSKYDIIVADIDGELAGYGYGEIEIAEKEVSYIRKGERKFVIEEIYIKPAYRDSGVGGRLFEALSETAKASGCALIELYAASKDYQKLLRFYVEKLGMDFWSAHLIKRI